MKLKLVELINPLSPVFNESDYRLLRTRLARQAKKQCDADQAVVDALEARIKELEAFKLVADKLAAQMVIETVKEIREAIETRPVGFGRADETTRDILNLPELKVETWS